jgi:hypothetical protein
MLRIARSVGQVSDRKDHMPFDIWLKLGLFTVMFLSLSLYVLAASGQFPIEHRSNSLRSAAGVIALVFAWRFVPWYAAVIGGGFAFVIAPLVLRSFSDAFVNGRVAVLLFSGASVALAAAMLAGSC